jgi:hypothetical protein
MDYLADMITAFGFAAMFVLAFIAIDRFWAFVELVARAFIAACDGYERLRVRGRQRLAELYARPYHRR